MAFPEPDLTSTQLSKCTRWKRVSQLYQQIWKFWQRNYLNKLQERKKWKITKGYYDSLRCLYKIYTLLIIIIIIYV